MTYKLFLDDYRVPSFLDIKGFQYPYQDPWEIARSMDEAIQIIKQDGLPNFIAFDHDLEDEHYDGKLGQERTGYEFAKWFADYVLDNKLELPANFDYVVHSMNPAGAENIRAFMRNFIRFYQSNRQ